jgi:ornithine cyclodeaminase
MSGHIPAQVRATVSAEDAVRGADIVVLVTSSPTPVVHDAWIAEGAHVVSVGACRPDQREMDPVLVARSRLFVDSKAAALVESGDVVLGMREGRFTESHIASEIGQVVLGRAAGRTTTAEVTIFKSLGMAVEDVVAADLVLSRAVERGSGAELTL